MSRGVKCLNELFKSACLAGTFEQLMPAGLLCLCI